MKRQTIVRVIWFLGFLALFSAPMNYLLLARGFRQSTVLAIMWCPCAAALAASFMARKPLREIGWRLGGAKWLFAGWAIPIAYASGAYLTAWMTGLGAVPDPKFIENIARTLHVQSAPAWLVAIAAYVLVAVVVSVVNLIAATGEEIGWRGYLVPELERLLGFRSAALLTGAIWAAWHWAGIIWSRYNGGAGTPKWYQLACFSAMAILISVPLAWVRMKSGSMWPAALFHATHNGIVQAFFDPMTRDTGRTAFFIGEFGILLACSAAVAAWLTLRRAGTVASPSPRALVNSESGSYQRHRSVAMALPVR
jgi:uncharacterized protein